MKKLFSFFLITAAFVLFSCKTPVNNPAAASNPDAMVSTTRIDLSNGEWEMVTNTYTPADKSTFSGYAYTTEAKQTITVSDTNFNLSAGNSKMVFNLAENAEYNAKTEQQKTAARAALIASLTANTALMGTVTTETNGDIITARITYSNVGLSTDRLLLNALIAGAGNSSDLKTNGTKTKYTWSTSAEGITSSYVLTKK